MKFLIAFIFFGSLCSEISGSACGNDANWAEYKDEKCYLLVQTFANKANALEQCLSYEGSLPVIMSNEEQSFINQLIYEDNEVIDGVWIGATRYEESQDFIWDNGDDMSYFSNWAPENPSNNTLRNCARMVSEAGKTSRKENGEWEDISCGSNNLILCEKMQIIEYSVLVREFQKLRFEYDHTRAEVQEIREILDGMVPEKIPDKDY